jgi:hypothetical protein
MDAWFIRSVHPVTHNPGFLMIPVSAVSALGFVVGSGMVRVRKALQRRTGINTEKLVG